MTARKIFISYSHRDTGEMDRLQTHLGVFQHTETSIEVWSDQRINAGQDWALAIEQAMADARVSVLFITAPFLASHFIQTTELPKLLERHANAGMYIMPILARHCSWELVPWLRQIQIRPKDGKPVWRQGGDVDRSLKIIVLEISKFLNQEPSDDPPTRLAQEQAIQAEIDAIQEKLNALSEIPHPTDKDRIRQGVLDIEISVRTNMEISKMPQSSLMTNAPRSLLVSGTEREARWTRSDIIDDLASQVVDPDKVLRESQKDIRKGMVDPKISGPGSSGPGSGGMR
jgi:hypothetical protein